MTKQVLSALTLVLAIVSLTVGGTLATWSDSETSSDNYIETGSVDLKVNDQDDSPWGGGLAAFFEIDSGEICTPYSSTQALWNAGCADGWAYLHIKNLVDSDSLSQHMNLEIRYDGVSVTSGTIRDLACHQIELGDLPENAIKEVEIVLHPTGGAPGALLTFDIQFELSTLDVELELAGSWSDSEMSHGNYFRLGT